VFHGSHQMKKLRIGMFAWESLYSVKVEGIAPHVSELSEALVFFSINSFEVWILPKLHVNHLASCTDEMLQPIGDSIRFVVKRLSISSLARRINFVTLSVYVTA